MSTLSLALFIGGGISGIVACSMFALSYGWKARLYKTKWDYRFTGLIFALLAALAFGVGWYKSRR